MDSEETAWSRGGRRSLARKKAGHLSNPTHGFAFQTPGDGENAPDVHDAVAMNKIDDLIDALLSMISEKRESKHTTSE